MVPVARARPMRQRAYVAGAEWPVPFGNRGVQGLGRDRAGARHAQADAPHAQADALHAQWHVPVPWSRTVPSTATNRNVQESADNVSSSSP